MNVQKIAAALRMLADAIEDSEPPMTLEPEDLVPTTPPEVATTLEDLQNAGATLLRNGKKAEFVSILKGFDLKNLSSADKTDYDDILKALKAAI